MFEWHDLIATPNASTGVLELHETLTPPGLALELHVVAAAGKTVAWWCLESGTILRVLEPGKA